GDGRVLQDVPQRGDVRVRGERTAVRLRRALVLYGSAAVLLVVGAFPLLWMLSTALKPSGEIFATPPALVPSRPTLENFRRLFVDTKFVTFFENSVVVA